MKEFAGRKGGAYPHSKSGGAATARSLTDAVLIGDMANNRRRKLSPSIYITTFRCRSFCHSNYFVFTAACRWERLFLTYKSGLISLELQERA